jgi:hypothetical protein
MKGHDSGQRNSRRPLPVVYRNAILATVREHKKAFGSLLFLIR